MKCHYKTEDGVYCQKMGAKGRAFCSEHKRITKRLYFTKDYAGYKQLDAEYIFSLPLSDWFVARGVALRVDRSLEKVIDRLLAGELHLIRTKSPKVLKELLIAVRLMIAEKEYSEIEMSLFRFFNTEHEPHSRVVRDFITNAWFTDEERLYLNDFIRKNFIEKRTLKHQIKTLVRTRKKEIRLAKQDAKNLGEEDSKPLEPAQ